MENSARIAQQWRDGNKAYVVTFLKDRSPHEVLIWTVRVMMEMTNEEQASLLRYLEELG